MWVFYSFLIIVLRWKYCLSIFLCDQNVVVFFVCLVFLSASLDTSKLGCSAAGMHSAVHHGQLAPRACHEHPLVKYDHAPGCCRWTSSWNMSFLCLQTIASYSSSVLKKRSNTFHGRLFTRGQDQGNKLLVAVLMNNLAGCPSSPDCHRLGNDLLKNVLLTGDIVDARWETFPIRWAPAFQCLLKSGFRWKVFLVLYWFACKWAAMLTF